MAERIDWTKWDPWQRMYNRWIKAFGEKQVNLKWPSLRGVYDWFLRELELHPEVDPQTLDIEQFLSHEISTDEAKKIIKTLMATPPSEKEYEKMYAEYKAMLQKEAREKYPEILEPLEEKLVDMERKFETEKTKAAKRLKKIKELEEKLGVTERKLEQERAKPPEVAPLKIRILKDFSEGIIDYTAGSVVDSIPRYEVTLVKHDDVIDVMTMEELFELAGTIVETDRGEKIKTLLTDVLVPGPSPNAIDSKLKWCKLRKVIKHPFNGTVLSIATQEAVIDVTPNHPIKNHRYLIEATKLKTGKTLARRKLRYRHNDKGLFVGSNELAWLYGLFVAEGWVSKDHAKIANKDVKLLEKARDIIKREMHHSATIPQAKDGTYYLDVNSRYLSEHFKQKCYTSKKEFNSGTKKVPTDILNAPLEVKKAFLEGYLCGDGTTTERGLISFTSKSRAVAFGTLEIFRSLGQSDYYLNPREDYPPTLKITITKGVFKTKPRRKVKKIFSYEYEGDLYDLEVESKDHTFYLGIGSVRVHNTRDLDWALDKIEKGVAERVAVEVPVKVVPPPPKPPEVKPPKVLPPPPEVCPIDKTPLKVMERVPLLIKDPMRLTAEEEYWRARMGVPIPTVHLEWIDVPHTMKVWMCERDHYFERDAAGRLVQRTPEFLYKKIIREHAKLRKITLPPVVPPRVGVPRPPVKLKPPAASPKRWLLETKGLTWGTFLALPDDERKVLLDEYLKEVRRFGYME